MLNEPDAYFDRKSAIRLSTASKSQFRSTDKSDPYKYSYIKDSNPVFRRNLRSRSRFEKGSVSSKKTKTTMDTS